MPPRPVYQPTMEESRKIRASREDRKAARAMKGGPPAPGPGSGEESPRYEQVQGRPERDSRADSRGDKYAQYAPSADAADDLPPPPVPVSGSGSGTMGQEDAMTRGHPPPPSASNGARRGSAARQRPPSYSGQVSEEDIFDQRRFSHSDDPYRASRDMPGPRHDETLAQLTGPTSRGNVPRSSPPRHHGEGRRGSGRPNSEAAMASSSKQSHHHHRDQRNGGGGQQHPQSMASGNSINRLSSPTISKTVLQPLEHKMHEYSQLMTETQDEMDQLDDQIRSLQERRQQAEDRYFEAKTKHDDYERQHSDVGRALRGEIAREEMLMQQRQRDTEQQHQQQLQQHQDQMQQHHQQLLQQQQSPRFARPDSFDDDDHRPMSQGSSMAGRKVGTFDRIRMSLFKGH